MNNKSLISLSLLVFFGVSACSSTSQKPNQTVKKSTSPQKVTTSASIRPAPAVKTNTTNQWHAKQRQIAAQKEQVRLAYNQAWQQQQIQEKAQAQARARNLRKQQANLQQNRLAQQYAAQQMQRQAQQRAAQQQKQNAQYLAMLQQRNNATPRPQPKGNIASLTASEIRTIGDKIFRNESGGTTARLGEQGTSLSMQKTLNR